MANLRAHVIVVHPYGHLTTGDSVTRSRCERALKLIRSSLISEHEYRVILTAGYSKELPDGSTDGKIPSLAQQMKDFFVAHGIPEDKIIVSEKKAFGTINEIYRVLKVIRSEHIIPISIWCVTDVDHMKRVLPTWKALVPKDWQVFPVPSPRAMPVKERFKDWGKRWVYKFRLVPQMKPKLKDTFEAIARHERERQKAPA